MTKIYTTKDVNPDAMKDETIAIIGYGSQGHAHAQNLRDSGFNVIVGARRGGPSWSKAEAAGFEVYEMADAAEMADLIAILTPDMAQAEIFEKHIKDHLKDGDALMFAHGFSVHYKRIKPPTNVDVMLVAPKGPGALVRREFEIGRGVPALFAVQQDASGKARDRAMAYAHGVGGTKGGVIETSFSEETETDLFGEQAVLCGGASELIVKGFETLVEAGYQPEVAYFECLHEMKLIVDLLNEGGMAKMYDFISETAKYGDFVSGPRVINEDTKDRMRDVLKDIQDGTFAKNWIRENEEGLPNYRRIEAEDRAHQIETVGRDLRSRMSWIAESNEATQKDAAE